MNRSHWAEGCRESAMSRDRRGQWLQNNSRTDDDHSEQTDQRGLTCAAFLQRAVTGFRARGITTRHVKSDNGSKYVSRLPGSVVPAGERCVMNNVFELNT